VENKRVRAHAVSCLFVATKTGDEPWSANSGWHCTNWRGLATPGITGNFPTFFDYEIVAVYLWAVLHDRSVSWACEPAHWPEELWPRRRLPSQSTMSRRLRTTEVQWLLQQMEQRLAPLADDRWVLLIDGKPLVIGTYSKDGDAAWGRVGQTYAKGYKLHAVYGAGPLPLAWEVVPLNESELDVAARLIPSLQGGGGYLLGDKAFDSNPLHDTALSAGYQLVAERKRPNTKLGHRRHSPGRLRSIELLQTVFGQALYQARGDIERQFGWLTNHGGGLAPLPNWVRRLPRVRLWVQAKLLIHAAYVYLHSRSPPLAVA
jgi:Transposase DDE domain